MEPPFLKVGRLYLTADCRIVYEIVTHDTRIIDSAAGDCLTFSDGFPYLARPCRTRAPYRPLTGPRWPEQWFTRAGRWTRQKDTATDIDLTIDIGSRAEYPLDHVDHDEASR